MNNKLRIIFELTGINIDFDEISLNLDLMPTTTKKENEYPDVTKKAGLARDSWSYSTDYIEEFSFQNEVNRFIELFLNKKNSIIQLKEKYDLKSKIFVVLYFYKNIPLECISLPENCISFLNTTKTLLDFDLYLT